MASNPQLYPLLGLISGNSTFAIDFLPFIITLAAAGLFYIIWKWKKHFYDPFIGYSDIKLFGTQSSRSAFRANIPQKLMLLSWICFLFAFADPRLLIDRHRENPSEEPPQSPVEGLAIYLVLDQSGSMAESISASGETKIDLLKRVTKQFIMGDPETGLGGRPDDLLGLVVFARGAHVLSPLTLDHAALLAELTRFAPIGERDEDGTSIGYAIFKTASMIAATKHYAQELIDKGEPAYTIKSTVIILITDGMQDPNPLDKGKRLRNMDIPEAAAYAASQGIRLYIVNVEPKMAMDEFAPHRHMMQRAAEMTGGKFYLIDVSANLGKIYKDIDSLEKSRVPAMLQKLDKDKRPDLYRRKPLSPYLICLGLLFLFSSLWLETTVCRRIP